MIVITWSLIAQYAASCIKRFEEVCDEKVIVLTRKGNNPELAYCKKLGLTMLVVDREDERSIKEVVGEIPRVYLSGWHIPAFFRWAKEVRRAGGHVVLPTDECYLRYPIKEFLRCIRWKLILGRMFDRIFVCGAAGRRLYRWYGVPDRKIYESMCAADTRLFYSVTPLSRRPTRMVFVGQYIERKNVVNMCQAFRLARAKHKNWTLDLYGAGCLRSSLYEGDGVKLHGFKSAQELGEIYRNAQCLILGSLEDNWGVVVHEASLSGCLLALSNRVGAAADFATKDNSVIFKAESISDFTRALEKIMSMSDEERDRGQRVSVELGNRFSPDTFARNLLSIVKSFEKE